MYFILESGGLEMKVAYKILQGVKMEIKSSKRNLACLDLLNCLHGVKVNSLLSFLMGFIFFVQGGSLPHPPPHSMHWLNLCVGLCMQGY